MAQKVYKINPSGSNSFSGTALTSLTSFSIDKQADESTQGSDGKPWLQGAFYDNLSYVVTVNGTDNSIDVSPDGCNGSLVLTGVLRDNGSCTAVSSLTFTFAEASCSGSTSTINHAGNSEVTYTFRVVSVDGLADPLTVS